MQNQSIIDSDYCQNCGTPLLFPNKPCPNCSVTVEKIQTSSIIDQTIYFDEKNLVSPRENIYFAISLIISILFYLVLLISVVGIFYGIIGVIFGLITHGMFIGYLRGNAIRINNKQFPEVYKIAQNLSVKLNLKKMPDIYVVQEGGALNAFATKFLSKHFVVIFSDVLELAYKEGKRCFGIYSLS